MDITQIRNDIANYGDKIFLNSAGASLMPRSVVDKINDYLDMELAQGGYKVADLQAPAIEQFYQETATLLGCQSHNIAFAHDATDAYAKALSSIPFADGDVIITSNDDYSSNQIQFISLQQRLGVNVLRIQNLENGDLDIDHFEQLVRQHTPKLVAITHIPTNSGLIQNVEAVGAICHEKDILFLLDACQSVGQLEVDIQALRCDFLSATGRKFLRGPRGTGLLYVSDKVIEKGYTPLFMDAFGAKWTGVDGVEVKPDAKRFQTWEAPFAFIVGLAEAVRYANNLGMQNIVDRNQTLIGHFREKMRAIPGVTVYDKGSKRCNILTFRKEGKSLEETSQYLQSHAVYHSTSELEWGLIDFGKKGVDGVVRLSPHYFNTLEELDRVVELLKAM